MRPVGDCRLMRYQVAPEVAAKPVGKTDMVVSNLLTLTPGINMPRVMVPSDWDGSAGGGGYGGSRNVPLVPEPFIAA